MTKPTVPIDKGALGLSLINLMMFFGLLETWHQFRDSFGWESSGWFALFIGIWIGSVMSTKHLRRRMNQS